MVVVAQMAGDMANYKDAGNLKTRISLYRYRKPDIDPVEVALRLLPPELDFALDVGCGHGRYVQRLRETYPEATVVGIDAAPGMLSEVEPPIMVADAQAVPYPDDAADAVLAMHMLYHVPDIAAAVAEFRRVLKPGGTLLISTNAADDMAGLYELWRPAIAEVLEAAAFSPRLPGERFDSAVGPGYLKAEFDSVEPFEERGIVSVPDPQPILDYVDSTRDFAYTDGATHDAIMTVLRRRLEAHFERHDRFEFEKAVVFYRCR